jgi:hypothetical protein
MAETINLGNSYWAVKDNSLLAYNDENGNYKPLPFDFTRASTATVVNKQGLIESVASGVPRIDFSNDANGALLLEPQSTNLITYSEDFSQWTPVNSTAISNITLSNPSGVSDVGLAEGTAGTDIKYFIEAAVSTVKSTASIYLKYNSHQWVQITGLGGKTSYANFDIQNGILGNSSGGTSKITLFGDGWYRCELSESADQNGSNIAVALVESGTSTRLSNTTSIGSIYIWGAQLEENSYATSYIPTLTGTTQTRVAEVCGGAGSSSSINSEEGVLYAEISTFDGSDDVFGISLSDGSSTNRIFLNLQTPESRYRAYSTGGGDITFQGLDVTSTSKVAVRYSLNNFSLWVDGIKRGEDLVYAGIAANTLNSLSFDRNGFGELDFYGNTKDLRVYTTVLTDSELQALTTL